MNKKRKFRITLNESRAEGAELVIGTVSVEFVKYWQKRDGLNSNDYDKWTDNDMDWSNTETERINLMMVDFKKNEFEISDVKLSHLNKELLIKGKFNKNKIEINIKKA